MRILGIIVVFICTLSFAVVGGLLIAVSFNLFTVKDLTDFLQQIFALQNIHLIVGGFGLVLIAASLSIAQITLGRMQREKTIAFNNPDDCFGRWLNYIIKIPFIFIFSP